MMRWVERWRKPQAAPYVEANWFAPTADLALRVNHISMERIPS
jgi:hypothetical protein